MIWLLFWIEIFSLIFIDTIIPRVIKAIYRVLLLTLSWVWLLKCDIWSSTTAIYISKILLKWSDFISLILKISLKISLIKEIKITEYLVFYKSCVD